MRLTLYLATVALVLSLTLTAAASTGPTVGLVFRHVYSQHSRLCGSPVAGVTWTGLSVHERFQHCTLKAREAVITPTPRSTSTPVPPTVGPTRTRIAPTPTNVPPLPTIPPAKPTATPSSCSDTNLNGCLLAILNSERQQYGVAPLTLSAQQSACSLGHAQAMAATGYIWHTNPLYPQYSFPNGICISGWQTIGENVGEAPGDPAAAVQQVNSLMMSEPGYALGCQSSHKCNILFGSYRRVGLGIVASGGNTYVVEDFAGP